MEAAGADVLDAVIHLHGDIGDGFDGVGFEGEVDAFGFHQGDVLRDETGFRLGEDALEIIAAERPEFDADRQAALKFGQQV